MANFKTAKNILQDRDTYNRYYGDFRGVDFSSDHTQVHEQRLAFAVNMFRDYQSGQGQALETIAGFRRRVVLPEESSVHGMFYYKHKNAQNETLTKVLIHSGNKLYLWGNYPNSVNVVATETVETPQAAETSNGTPIYKAVLPSKVFAVVSLRRQDGTDLTALISSYDPTTHILTYASSEIAVGERLLYDYKEGVIESSDALFSGMNDRRSASFIFNNKLYIIDGLNYLVYDGFTVKNVLSEAYIPTTYINVVPSGENADIGKEYEQRNILQPKFKTTFIADGKTTEFYLNENELNSVVGVEVYGETKTAGIDYTVDLANGKIIFTTAPAKPETVVQVAATDGAAAVYYPEFYAGIVITASKIFTSVSGVTKQESTVSELITKCTLATIYDNRVFLSGNPNYPNHIFYCGLNNATGFIDPTYFGVLNYMQDGVGIAPITGMITVADTLMVLKNDTQQDGSTYFHTAQLTDSNIQPKIYPSSQGLSGIGCLGACVNFLDDPIFISRLGVEAVGQLSVRYERANEHRSSLIDAKLVNMNLSHAIVEEWNGYLLVLVDGKMFMGDSRQKYQHDIGVPQYEWYYVEGIGVYKNQYPEYSYALYMSDELVGAKVHWCRKCGKSATHCTCSEDEKDIIEIPLQLANAVYYADTNETKDLRGTVVNEPNYAGVAETEVVDEGVKISINDETFTVGVYYTVHPVVDIISGEITHYEAYLCDGKGNYTGGVLKQATTLKNMADNIFFGTENGVVCSFNFDKRGADGEIPTQYYSFDERTIYCGAATKMDCCGIPHLTKNTIKRSTVIKTKSFRNSAAKIKVRTNKKPYQQIARINTSLFSFEDMNFSDFTFSTSEQSLFAIKEKEKQWVEKQYYIYSDEYLKPFALYYVSYRYQVVGRLKQ